jgi:hypothetical protein
MTVSRPRSDCVPPLGFPVAILAGAASHAVGQVGASVVTAVDARVPLHTAPARACGCKSGDSSQAACGRVHSRAPMDVLLVSGSSRTRSAHRTVAWAGELGEALTAAGHRVRWLCPWHAVGGGPAIATPVEPIVVARRPPTFRAVFRHLSHSALEQRFTAELRHTPPDLVHVLAFGGTLPAALPWIAQRLGVPCLVSVQIEEALCHRGTLVDERGKACDAWDDPVRCARCCTTVWKHGLGPAAAFLARCCRPLGGLSPFPNRLAFVNRLDVVVHSLSCANRVLVEDEAGPALLARAGVPARLVRRSPSPTDAEAWLATYAELLAASAEGR